MERGGEWGPQAATMLVVREAKSWCGPSEMEGHFSPGNELTLSQQTCPICTRP